MSYRHQEYLRQIKRKRLIVFSLQLFLLISLLIIWQLCADKNIVNSFISSSPKRVIETIVTLHNNHNLYPHIWVTLYETIISFILSILIGFIGAIILWWFNTMAKVIEPYLTALNSLPKVALGPILLIWCGANVKSIIIMALLISVIIALTTIYQGFLNVDINKVKLIKSFGGTKRQILKYLIIPNSYPIILSTLKLNISMCLIGLLPPVGENLNSNKYCSKYLFHYL